MKKEVTTESKRIIYCIPGLGQDHRVFEGLKIKDSELRFIDWIEAKEDEDIPTYAARLAEQIEKVPNLYLLGVSLGGIMSVEIAKLIPVKKLILISTVKNRSEMPPTFEWMGKVPIKSNSLPKFAIEAQVVLKPFYGKANQKGIALFEKMLRAASLDFIRWAWNHIPEWKSKGEPKSPFIHLHGTADLVFPIKHIDQAITLKGATHFAIFNDMEKINSILEKHL
jgi:pimeloyl-ACP methyl ester carboxylesterase